MAQDIPVRAVAADGLNTSKGQVISAHGVEPVLFSVPYVSGEDAHGNKLLSFALLSDISGGVTLPIAISDVTFLQTTIDVLEADIVDLQAQITAISSSGQTDAYENTWMGDTAFDSHTAASALRNTLIGYAAGTAITTGDDNTAVGRNSLKALTANVSATAVGSSALLAATGSYNVGIGGIAGYLVTTGAGNVLVGYQAGGALTTGSYNTHLGYATNSYGTGITNSTAIGANAEVGASNTMVLGDGTVDVSINGWPKGTTSAPQGKLHVGGRIHFNEVTANPSAAQLTSGANAQDRVGMYMKADKLVFAYNLAGTVNYLTFTLDGATTTFTNDTTAP